ncbi:MAG: VWA domain-containing protein, partial [Anaerolineales bacterium]
MKTTLARTLASLLLVCITGSACSALVGAPQATQAPRQYPTTEMDAPAKEWALPATPAPLPTATVGSTFELETGASTGGTDEPNDKPYGDVFFEAYGVNPRIDTEDDHLSTFAIDVDTASYTVMRRFITDGYLPDDDSVRVEEYVNYFEQGYAAPDDNAFAIYLEGAPSPYAENYHVLRVGVKGYDIDPEMRDDVVLTFVIDVSGSMDRENRLELVKDSLRLLVDALRPTDQVGIVVYGSEARIVLPPTMVEERREILRAIQRLRPEGATNAEQGLILAYQMASEAFDPATTNRVILCSDGVANVGNTGPESILNVIKAHARDGIYLTTVGFGMGNYNDVLMEQLADNGDGFYAYVDDIKEAERVFVHNLPSTLQVIARDAKIQVDFNPDVVSRYRLIGYENRDVADEDFRNDAVDAGEIGLGHSVTALYEVKFHQDPLERIASMPALNVTLRWEDPDSGKVNEMNQMMLQSDFTPEFAATSTRFQLAVVVAQYAEVLRSSYWAKEAGTSLNEIANEAQRLAKLLTRDGDVQEFAKLTARSIEL